METEARTQKWGWLFRTYVQWHAIAFLLSELCVRTKGEAVDRAWRALEATAGRWWFPLGESSPYRKGKAGCLWKPLRKLMAKARAARERELALERASQAIKNKGIYYSDFPHMMDQLPTDPPPANQPSPENLDKMLRPSAPRLGEMPIAKPPSWAGSPALGNIDFSLPSGVSTVPVITENDHGHSPLPGTNSAKDPNAVQNFQSLSEHGLDYLIRDVMGDVAFDGSSIHDAHDEGHAYAGAPPNPRSINRITNGTLALTQGAFTQEPNAFTNSDSFNNSPAGMGSSGQSSNSPVLDGENMDWTGWDDLVSQYGMEGPQQVPTANGAGHLGMVHWF